MSPTSRPRSRAVVLTAVVLSLVATACGGGSESANITAPAPLADDGSADAAPATPGNGVAPAGTVDPDAAQAAADANIGSLQGNDDVRLIEVLNVADGAVTTLDGAVVGDRPVLLWFWAPH